MARRPSSVCPSVNFCANCFFSQANGRIATTLSQGGLQVSVHPGCAQRQGQGQRSRDMRIFLDSWNELLRHWWSGFVKFLVIFRAIFCLRLVLQHGPMHLKQTLTSVASNSPGHSTDSGSSTPPTNTSSGGKRLSRPTNHRRPDSPVQSSNIRGLKSDLVGDVKPTSTNEPESRR